MVIVGTESCRRSGSLSCTDNPQIGSWHCSVHNECSALSAFVVRLVFCSETISLNGAPTGGTTSNHALSLPLLPSALFLLPTVRGSHGFVRDKCRAHRAIIDDFLYPFLLFGSSHQMASFFKVDYTSSACFQAAKSHTF